MTVIVVGAGISGLACARELLDAGIAVRVIERAPAVGGRLASVRLDDRMTDVGAAYLTADDPAFLGRLQTWRIDGLARPWTDTFRGQRGTGPMRWAAPGGLRSLAQDLARELEITLNTDVTELPRADTVVLAMPGPQAMRIADLAPAREQSWSPSLAVVLTYPERVWADFHGAFVPGHPIVATICDDGDRRGDLAPVLVAYATPEFAADGDSRKLAAAVGGILGVEESPRIDEFPWPYAMPAPGRPPFARVGDVFLCGDAFGKPRVQTAWLSGRAVARAIISER